MLPLNANSSTSLLANGESFTGSWVDITQERYSNIVVIALSDRSGLLYVDFSADALNVIETHTFTVAASTTTKEIEPLSARYVRTRFTNNSGSTQTTFLLSSSLIESRPTSVQQISSSGAATAVKQDTGNTSLSSIDTKLPSGLTVTANRLQVELPSSSGGLTDAELRASPVPTSSASLPLPAGASTSAKQDTIIGHVDGIETSLGSLLTELQLKADLSETQPVSGTVTANAGTGTFAVSAASLPLPSGAATSALQTTGNTSLSSIDGKLPSSLTVTSTRLLVDPSGVTSPVSAASLPLPSGASTSAKQPALGTAGAASSDVISIQGVASMTAVKVDGSATTQPVSGTVSATQSGTWTIQPGNTANTTAWKVDGSAVTQPVSTDAQYLSPLTGYTAKSNKVITNGVTAVENFTLTQNISLTHFEFSGRGPGAAELLTVNTAATLVPPGGGFNSSGDVTSWPYTGLNSGAITISYSTTQSTEGTGSMKWVYTASAASSNHTTSYTYSTPQDFSVWETISVSFRNDTATGTTRELNLILIDNRNAQRAFILSGTLGTAPFTSNTWVTLTGTVANPTLDTATFDIHNVLYISLAFKDSVTKSGTIYWDNLIFTGQYTHISRLLAPANQTAQMAIAPTLLNTGDVIALRYKNNDTVSREFYAVARGVVR